MAHGRGPGMRGNTVVDGVSVLNLSGYCDKLPPCRQHPQRSRYPLFKRCWHCIGRHAPSGYHRPIESPFPSRIYPSPTSGGKHVAVLVFTPRSLGELDLMQCIR